MIYLVRFEIKYFPPIFICGRPHNFIVKMTYIKSFYFKNWTVFLSIEVSAFWQLFGYCICTSPIHHNQVEDSITVWSNTEEELTQWLHKLQIQGILIKTKLKKLLHRGGMVSKQFLKTSLFLHPYACGKRREHSRHN